jgi:uncharacterized protein YlaN (UPF0358 family)
MMVKTVYIAEEETMDSSRNKPKFLKKDSKKLIKLIKIKF